MATHNGWKLGFCQCTQKLYPCLLTTCCCWLGLALVQYKLLSKFGSPSPTPVAGCLATCCCTCLGAAWTRQAIRKNRGIEREQYWYDCGAYASGCVCCLGVQEYAELES